MEVDDDGSTAVDSMIAEYRAILHAQANVPSRYYWAIQKDGNLLQSPGAEQFQEYIGMGTIFLQIALMECNLFEAAASKLRERLLLKAARNGMIFLVRELLCPSEINGRTSCPVSANLLDENKNTIFHLAVLSKNVSLVKWLLRYAKEQKQKDRWKFNGWVDSLNLQYETPFSLAIRSGKRSMVNNIGSSHSWTDSHVHCWNLHTLKHLDLETIWQPICDHRLSISELKDHIVHWREQYKDNTDYNYNVMNRCVAILDARAAANPVIRDTIDSISRPLHLSSIKHVDFLPVPLRKLPFATLKENFGGILFPWWDPNLSSFDIDYYVANRTEEELSSLFFILSSAIQDGRMEDALWLLDHFKAPPSLMSIKGRGYYDMDWYVGHSLKLTEVAIEGWVAKKVIEFRSNEEEESRLNYLRVGEIVKQLLGSSESGSKFKNDQAELLRQMQWEQNMCPIGDRRWDMHRNWQEIHKSMPAEDKHSAYPPFLFGVEARDFTAVKLACSNPVDNFEDTEQAQLLKFFLQKTYKEDPNFLSIDLPNLTQFVVLDHLQLFQFLTKLRDDQERPFLDLSLPLFCPSTVDSGQVMEDAENEDIFDQCCICLGSIEKPYCLECGHSFHHECIFEYAFPVLRISREAEQDDPDDQAHQVLANYPHLSYNLGFTQCPYCRKSVKPSLPEAFALNLADGLKRSQSEKQNRSCSPHLDLRVESDGITVGETILAFAACAGAISIFQWLVTECKIDPRSVKAGGINVLHHAISHKQILIVRWLLEFGYKDMLFGGMERDAFDNYIPPLTPGISLEGCSALLEDASTVERLKVLSRALNLRNLIGEKEVLSQPPNEDEIEIIKCQHQIETKSPMHFLLMNGLEQFDDGFKLYFFDLLRSKNISAIPTNWYLLSLAFSLDSTMRSDAKAYVSQKILSFPSSFWSRLPSVSECLDFKDVLTPGTIEHLSPLSIAMNAEKYNLWELLRRGEKDWKLFLQVATACHAWHCYTTYDWFEDTAGDEAPHLQIVKFIGAVICFARVDVLAAFTKMESFCDPEWELRGCFDLFSEEQNCYSSSKALRPILAALGKMETFLPLFQHVDLVNKVVRDSYSTVDQVAKDILAGKSLQQVLDYIESQRSMILSLPEVQPPLGVGSYDEIFKRLDMSQTDLLSHKLYIDEKWIIFFDALVEMRNTDVYQWILSLIMKHINNSDNDESGVSFVQKVIKRIVETSDAFAFEAFISFCTGRGGPVRYQDKVPLLMADLLNIDSGVTQVRDGDGWKRLGSGGIIGVVLSYMLVIQTSFSFDGKDDSFDPGPTIEKIESMHSFFEFVLAKPEIALLLSSEKARAKLLFNIFGGATKSLNSFGSQCPHIIFRVLALLKSKGFDLACRIEDQNLLTCCFEILGSPPLYNDEDVPQEVLDQLCAGDKYKDENGKTIKSKSDLIRWLALSAGVSMQHLVYQDVTKLLLIPKYMFMTESEFDELKYEQFININGQSSTFLR